MNLLVWVILGILSGLVANWVDPEESQQSVVRGIVIGIIGSVGGGILATLLLGVQIIGFNLPAFIVALLATIVFLFAGNFLRKAS